MAEWSEMDRISSDSTWYSDTPRLSATVEFGPALDFTDSSSCENVRGAAADPGKVRDPGAPLPHGPTYRAAHLTFPTPSAPVWTVSPPAVEKRNCVKQCLQIEPHLLGILYQMYLLLRI